jgi:hypothetical protein
VEVAEHFDDGTLTITVGAGGADLALQDAASGSTTIEDAEFRGVFMAHTPG